MKIFGSRYVIALGIPIIFLLAGGFSKKLVYGGWKWEYFFLGTEGTLAAISSSLVYLAELTQKTKAQSVESGIVLVNRSSAELTTDQLVNSREPWQR